MIIQIQQLKMMRRKKRIKIMKQVITTLMMKVGDKVNDFFGCKDKGGCSGFIFAAKCLFLYSQAYFIYLMSRRILFS